MNLTQQDIRDLRKAIEITHRYYVNADRPDWLQDTIQRLMLLDGRLERIKQ